MKLVVINLALLRGVLTFAGTYLFAWASSQSVPGQRADPPVRGWERLQGGLLFSRLRAVEPGTLDAAAWLTPDAPRNDVRLGIVITHFNRQAQVLPAIERIRKSVLARAELQGRITLTLVDNCATWGWRRSPASR